MSRVVIFGATSAIALACARLWVARGDAVFLVGRNPKKLAAAMDDLKVRAGAGAQGRVHGMQADLDDIGRHAECLQEAQSFLGEIDCVLIAQGNLPDQSQCEKNMDAAARALHTNGVAVAALCLAAANILEARRCGTLAVISSVAGDRGRQSNYVYGAGKGLLSLFLQGLRNRLFAHGVNVVTIKPGFVDTPMTAGIRKGLLWAQPERVASGIVRAIDRRRDVAYVPGFWRWIMLVIRLIPEPVFKRLKL